MSTISAALLLGTLVLGSTLGLIGCGLEGQGREGDAILPETEEGHGSTLSGGLQIDELFDATAECHVDACFEISAEHALDFSAIGGDIDASAVTLLLGAVGLYGVMAYSVSIRRRELGIRMALGARPADISRTVSWHGLRLGGSGIVIGMACALATSRLLRGLLYGVSPTDLVTLSATPAVLLVVAFIASWIPAHRAAAVHPAEVLQSQ